MVCSNPFDAYVEQILVRTKRREKAIKTVIARLADMVVSAQKECDVADDKLGKLRCRLSAAGSALDIVERERQ